GMILQCCWRGLSSALPGTRLGEYTRVGYFPTSYPTEPSRKLMGPAANARTDQMVYVDCREDYRIARVIYINGKEIARGITLKENCSRNLIAITFNNKPQ
ncbi:hypothetical protein IKQ19_08500, partial [Candidatus Saccharibacteria bacterium]|nr:hypothetical protein [Candidatus Saccharibacteria bacterium]